MYKFKLPIGDWSNDGHGICEYFLLSSSKSVEEVRETHFKIKEVTGIDLTEICSDYEENWFYDEEIIQKIINTGFDLKNKCEFEEDDGYVCGVTFKPRVLAELWIYLLMYVDKSLKLEFMDEEETPMLSFYGFDKKRRHISFIGYGLFD
jgi:hypothetical protein